LQPCAEQALAYGQLSRVVLRTKRRLAPLQQLEQ
jgi:hypothetical protein